MCKKSRFLKIILFILCKINAFDMNVALLNDIITIRFDKHLQTITSRYTILLQFERISAITK